MNKTPQQTTATNNSHHQQQTTTNNNKLQQSTNSNHQHQQHTSTAANDEQRITTNINDEKQQTQLPTALLPGCTDAATVCYALPLFCHALLLRLDNRIPAGRPAVRPPPLRFSTIMPNTFEESFKPAQGNPGGEHTHRHMPQIPQGWSIRQVQIFYEHLAYL